MSKPLLGGGAAAVALLSVSLLFVTQTSVAGTLAEAQKGTAAEIKAPGADVTPTSDATAADAAVTGKEAAMLTAAKPGGQPVESDFRDSSSVSAEPAGKVSVETESPAQVFTATAYSLRGRTASGMFVSRGLIAADHRVLPLGTRVRIEAGSYSGEYTVADTGGAVRGRKIDIWVPNTGEAMRFGRRPVKLTVLTRTRTRTAPQRTSR
jgi:3D (Asp-Asp-Asp) domain-containing protein